ncbi:hypothetical protein HanPI659440_Chr08g0297061 [Helianthus annuus]|nr:hypothetical protein HanPI659440_Chr08g0297061 [Helianthus annuus]
MNTYLFSVLVGAAKSSKSASRFGMSDTDGIISPKSIKKELALGQSLPEVKGTTTRAKAGSKRKKPSEPSGDLPLIEQQIYDAVSEKFAEIQILQGHHLADAEERILDLQTIAVAKDKRISHLEKENKGLEKQVLVAEMNATKERLEITEEAKQSAAIVILKIKLQMARETADPSYNRVEWDTTAWRQMLHELGDDEEPEEVLTAEAGGSGSKDPEDAAASGGSGEAKVDEVAKV